MVATRKPDSGEDEFIIRMEAIILDVGAWLGHGEHRQLDLGIVWGLEVAHLQVTKVGSRYPNPTKTTAVCSPAQLTKTAEAAGTNKLCSLLDQVGGSVGCTIKIRHHMHLSQWFYAEASPCDFAATGDAIGDAVLFVGDTHFGLRNPNVDDAMSDDDQPPFIASPDYVVRPEDRGWNNLNLLIDVLEAFKVAGIVNIVQLGDFYEIWESEYQLFQDAQDASERDFVARWAREIERHGQASVLLGTPGLATPEHIAYHEEKLRSEKESALAYEAALRYGTKAQAAERKIRAMWGAELERLDGLFSVRLRGNHDWFTDGYNGEASEDGKHSNAIVHLGLNRRIAAEHGHRFDFFNCYDFKFDSIGPATKSELYDVIVVSYFMVVRTGFLGGLAVKWAADEIDENIGEAEPAPRGKRATWVHTAAERNSKPDNEYAPVSKVVSWAGVVNLRWQMRKWILDNAKAKGLENIPRVYVIGHTHSPGLERIRVGRQTTEVED